MLFANDIVLVDKTRDGMNAKGERWQEALEAKDFKIISKDGEIGENVRHRIRIKAK